MNWTDQGFLVSKSRYSENSVIAELYTLDRGKVSGIIFGGTSKKIKNYLQVGNKLHVNYNSKNDNRMGYFKIEILNAYSPFYFDHKQKLSCITSAMNLIKILTAEAQANKKVYSLIEDLFNLLNDQNWLKKYIFWELELLKLLGYDLELENLVEKNLEDNKTVYFATSYSEKKYVPNFLIEKDLEVTDVNILLNRVYEILNKRVKNKKITFLGVTFKANTDDMRDSSSLTMIPALSKKGALIKYYDPTGFKKEFEKIKSVSYADSIKKSLDKSDLVIIHTEWNDFKSINFKNLVKGKKLIIYDMRNIYSPSKIKAQGFKYFSVGR